MNKHTLVIALFALLTGVSVGYFLSDSSNTPVSVSDKKKVPKFYRNPMNPDITSPVPAKDSMGMDYVPVYADEEKVSPEQEILFYRNPMNPDITSPVPTKDSMGMDYIPVYAENMSSEVTGTVTIDPVITQNIGVRTSKAVKTELSRTVRTIGRVDYDEESMRRLHSKIDGWVERVKVNKTGQSVKKGETLFSIYAPKLVSSQQEYLLALNNLATLEKSPFDEIKQGAKDLVKSSRERLSLLDVPEYQIRALEKTRKVKKILNFHSPANGTVININTREGQFVTPKTELYMMVNLNKVWVYADVYDYELPWIKLGDEVEMTLASVPGKTFKGSLSYIYPYAEKKTRTTKVRLVFDNKEHLLRPDMFAEVSIKSNPSRDIVVIPAEAIIRSGTNTQVFIAKGEGKFEPRLVKLGIESDGMVAVLEGVSAGDEVVTSAQFLVDSESKLREATAKMMEALKKDGDGHNDMRNDSVMNHDDMGGASNVDNRMIDHTEQSMQGGAHSHD
jgi:Cu(I)/Ag(I) efflux system membrane fusion protein